MCYINKADRIEVDCSYRPLFNLFYLLTGISCSAQSPEAAMMGYTVCLDTRHNQPMSSITSIKNPSLGSAATIRQLKVCWESGKGVFKLILDRWGRVVTGDLWKHDAELRRGVTKNGREQRPSVCPMRVQDRRPPAAGPPWLSAGKHAVASAVNDGTFPSIWDKYEAGVTVKDPPLQYLSNTNTPERDKWFAV